MTSNFAPSLGGSKFRCRIRHVMSVRKKGAAEICQNYNGAPVSGYKCWKTETSVARLFQIRSKEILREREEQRNADHANLTGATIGENSLRAERAVNSRGLCLVAKADAASSLATR